MSVFNYTSTCCSAPAKKPACQRAPEDKKSKEFSQCSLGTWNCTHCRRACAVIRSKV